MISPPPKAAMARYLDLAATAVTRRGIGSIAAATLSAWHLTAYGRVLGIAPPEGQPLATPRLTDGPFYPPRFSSEPSTSLIVGTMHPQARPLRLAGRVVDRSGRPVRGARVEIWQCDAGRRYHHPADGPDDAFDKGFLGYGWQPSTADGTYVFETIRPVAYPGRTPHIHVKVQIDGRAVLSSQVFMPDEIGANAGDFLWRSLGQGQPLALATLEPTAGRPTARFDIVLG